MKVLKGRVRGYVEAWIAIVSGIKQVTLKKNGNVNYFCIYTDIPFFLFTSTSKKTARNKVLFECVHLFDNGALAAIGILRLRMRGFVACLYGPLDLTV